MHRGNRTLIKKLVLTGVIGNYDRQEELEEMIQQKDEEIQQKDEEMQQKIQQKDAEIQRLRIQGRRRLTPRQLRSRSTTQLRSRVKKKN